MLQKLGLCAGLISLSLTGPAMAHHPGGTSNASEAGPVYTIPATTLGQGQVAAFVVYEFIRLSNLDNFPLATAAGQHQHVHSIGTISSAAIGTAFGITDDLMVSVRLPYVERTNIREGTHSHLHGGVVINSVVDRGGTDGVGDLTALGQWRFFNNQVTGTQAAVLFGLKAPTGRTRVYDRQGERFETEFQPGSGSYDPLAGLALSQRLGRWSFDTNVLYVFANKGAQRTNLGDRFQYNAALSYRLFGATAAETPGVEAGPSVAYMHGGHEHPPGARREDAPDHVHSHQLGVPHSHELEVPRVPQLAMDAVLELNGEWHDKQVIEHEKDRNSGGNVVYLSPGIRVAYGNLSGFVSVGVPVVNHMNGLQSKPRERVVTGLAFAF
jgi:hypothetical protein